MSTQQTIHEFLVRWDDSGKLQGAHVNYREAFTDDAGVLLFSRILDPRAVALTDSDTLASIAASINTGSLASINDLDAQVTQLEADKQAALTAQAQLQSQLDAANARIVELQPPAINGVPQEVTMRQAQLEMLLTPTLTPGVTLLDAVDAAINSIADPVQRRAAQITWSKSADMRRDNALIAQLKPVVQQMLGLADDAATEARIDQLFVSAAAR